MPALAAADIKLDQVRLEGDTIGRNFLVRFQGDAALAAWRVNKVMDTMRAASSWKEFEVSGLDGSNIQTYFNRDVPEAGQGGDDQQAGAPRDGGPAARWPVLGGIGAPQAARGHGVHRLGASDAGGCTTSCGRPRCRRSTASTRLGWRRASVRRRAGRSACSARLSSWGTAAGGGGAGRHLELQCVALGGRGEAT